HAAPSTLRRARCAEHAVPSILCRACCAERCAEARSCDHAGAVGRHEDGPRGRRRV
ncbi:hypothetical protein T492DRAFT_908610, partial [Pavlovales sp. CCMP2436]